MSPVGLLVIILFSLVGFAAFRHGRRSGEARPMLLGAALMAYGYFVSNALVSFLIGSVLTALLFLPQ